MIDNSFHIITFGCQMNVHDSQSVSYTHLDVYKRQIWARVVLPRPGLP